MSVTRVNMSKKKKKTGKRQSVEVELATELSEPCQHLAEYVIWIYGGPGIGKTTLCSMFETPYFLFSEAGGNALRLLKSLVTDWWQYPKYLEKLKVSNHKTIVVDVLELFYELCFRAVCKKHGITHPDDMDKWGGAKMWKTIRDEFLMQMGNTTTMGKGTIFVSHASLTKRKNRLGEELDDIHPALTGKPLEMMEGAMDLIGYIFMEKGKRIMQIRETDGVMAKCRLEENFNYTDGSPITFIPLGNSKKEAYENLLAAFNNKLPPPEKEVPKRKTPFKFRRK